MLDEICAASWSNMHFDYEDGRGTDDGGVNICNGGCPEE